MNETHRNLTDEQKSLIRQTSEDLSLVAETLRNDLPGLVVANLFAGALVASLSDLGRENTCRYLRHFADEIDAEGRRLSH